MEYLWRVEICYGERDMEGGCCVAYIYVGIMFSCIEVMCGRCIGCATKWVSLI